MPDQPRIPRSDYGPPRRAANRVRRGAVALHLRLPVELAEPLFARSQDTHVPVSAIVRAAVARELGVPERHRGGDGAV